MLLFVVNYERLYCFIFSSLAVRATFAKFADLFKILSYVKKPKVYDCCKRQRK